MNDNMGWFEFICSSDGAMWLFQLSLAIMGVLNVAHMIEARFSRKAATGGKIGSD